MPRNQAALDFMATRRSRPAKLLAAPAPDRAETMELLTIAARCPDHGKLVPFRFLVLEPDALRRSADALSARLAEAGIAEEQITKEVSAYHQSPLAIAVIFSPKASDKIPRVEQQHAAACACYGVLSAALAGGWGANWLTGKGAQNRDFLTQDLGLSADEALVGMVHIGTASTTPPERPRPDLAAITQWA